MEKDNPAKTETRTIVIDLEMAVVSKENHKVFPYNNEIIQIGAVMLDGGHKVSRSFNRYVKPVYGEITGFISNLTGITPDTVEDASGLEPVIYDFAQWIGDSSAVCVSWSMTDKLQLQNEMRIKSLENDRISSLFDNWIDCQPMFSGKMKTRRLYSLEKALIASDIDTMGRMHDGFSDAYNTALLYTKMLNLFSPHKHSR